MGRVVAADSSAAEIAAALMELLDDPAAPAAARRFASIIAGLGGGETATRMTAGLLRRPVTPGLR